MVEVGLFQSIRLTIKYQPGEANVIVDALSQIQRKEVEESMDDSVETIGAIEEQVLALSGFNADLTEEDLQKWTKAYKEDKGQVTVYTKLRQGQKHGDYYLTPSGLMARMVGDQ